MDFSNIIIQVNTLSTSHDTALIKLIHEGHSLVESFNKFGSAYNSRKNAHAHLPSRSGISLPTNIIQLVYGFTQLFK